MPRLRRRVSRHAQIITGDTPRSTDQKPQPRTKRKGRPKRPVDPAAVAAALAQLDVQAEVYATTRRLPGPGRNTLPVIGVCHDCGRPVSGERRFCGPCLTHHGV